MDTFDVIVKVLDNYINLSAISCITINTGNRERAYYIQFKNGSEKKITLEDGHYQKFEEYLDAIAPDILNDFTRKAMLVMQNRAKEELLQKSGINIKRTDIPE